MCELHFEKEDIIENWETKINGIIHLTPRNKPKLRENAVPCRNLDKDETIKKHTEKIEILSHKIIAPVKRKATEKVQAVANRKKTKTQQVALTCGSSVQSEEESRFTVVEENNELTDNDKLKTQQENEEEDHEKKSTLFENLYDEAFDVTLPSLLWGIHRDPERKFLAFSEFSPSTMSASKLLHISDDYQCKTFINNQLKSSQFLNLKQLVTEYVSTVLEELDKESITQT